MVSLDDLLCDPNGSRGVVSRCSCLTDTGNEGGVSRFSCLTDTGNEGGDDCAGGVMSTVEGTVGGALVRGSDDTFFSDGMSHA